MDLEKKEQAIRALAQGGIYYPPHSNEVRKLLERDVREHERIELFLDTEKRVAKINTWYVSGHNGDAFGERTTEVPWDKAVEYAYDLEVLNLKVVPDPRPTVFDRLLSDDLDV